MGKLLAVIPTGELNQSKTKFKKLNLEEFLIITKSKYGFIFFFLPEEIAAYSTVTTQQ